MKPLFFISIVFLFAACTPSKVFKPDNPANPAYTEISGENGFNYMKSLDAWEKLKAENGNSYIYKISFASVFGYRNYTEISVRNGKIISRKYEEFSADQMVDQDGNPVRNPADISYFENQDQINTNDEGHPAVLYEDLYRFCGKDFIIADPVWNTIYFETTEEGVMTRCGFVPNNCADDCYEGVYVSEFRWTR